MLEAQIDLQFSEKGVKANGYSSRYAVKPMMWVWEVTISDTDQREKDRYYRPHVKTGGRKTLIFAKLAARRYARKYIAKELGRRAFLNKQAERSHTETISA